MYGAFNCILFDHQTPQPYVLAHNGSFHVPLSVSSSASSTRTARASVWGPTCDALDCVCAAAALPGTLQVGDWLGWENMGAYTVCAASGFNGFEVSRVVYTTGAGAGAAEVREALRAFQAQVA